MELRGTIKGLASTFPKRKIFIELETDGRLEDIEKLQGKDLDITFKVHREKRSLDANAFLWSCLGKMGGVLNVPAWDMYLYSLERYGKYTYIQILESAYEDLKRMWRETKVVGDFMSVNMITGEKEKFLEVLCFFGSSTYNSKEFSRLLEGVISDMEQMGLERPTSDEMNALIAELERKENARREQEERTVSS